MSETTDTSPPSTLLAVSYAMEDEQLRRRVAAACLMYAANTAEPGDPYAAQVLRDPSMPDPSMIAAVCSNPAIATALIPDEGGLVDTSAVPDASIEYQVAQSWPEVAAKYTAQ